MSPALGPVAHPSAAGFGCVWNFPTTKHPTLSGGLLRLIADRAPGRARTTAISGHRIEVNPPAFFVPSLRVGREGIDPRRFDRRPHDRVCFQFRDRWDERVHPASLRYW